VISEGQALVEHGKVTVELSDLLERRLDASSDETLAQDVAEARATSQLMAETAGSL